MSGFRETAWRTAVRTYGRTNGRTAMTPKVSTTSWSRDQKLHLRPNSLLSKVLHNIHFLYIIPYSKICKKWAKWPIFWSKKNTAPFLFVRSVWIFHQIKSNIVASFDEKIGSPKLIFWTWCFFFKNPIIIMQRNCLEPFFRKKGEKLC